MISIDFHLHHLRRIVAAAFVLLAVFGVQGTAVAQTEIDITGGRVDPLPIAIAPFLAGGGAEETASTISGVITNDLGRSGYFAPLDPATFIEQITSFEQVPNLASWKQIQAKALVTGQAFMDGGKMRVEFRLWDVNTGQQLAAQQFTTSPKNDRRIGHMIADIIYKQMTGIDGYFDTRIVFVTEDGPEGQARQETGDHGFGWRECALSDARRRSRGDAALLAFVAGCDLYVLRQWRSESVFAQYRNRPA